MPTLKLPAQRYGIPLASLLLCLAALPACASAPGKVPPADFSGSWAVEWCDRSNPALDCGGFNITLTQEGSRLCGDFGGALVNLRQVDEGRIVGTAVGDTAVLVVESNRNGSITLVRAEHLGATLKWQIVDEVRRGDSSDIDVIASNDELKRQEQPGQHGSPSAPRRSCNQINGNTLEHTAAPGPTSAGIRAMGE